MHGRNEVRPREISDKLQVAEIFYTIQGEGPYSGMPAVFVRLTGCNLRCHFCDTQWDDHKDKHLTVSEIIEAVRHTWIIPGYPEPSLIVLTGGEPVRQDCGNLVTQLSLNYIVQVETAGSYWNDWLLQTTIVCSPKTKAVHPKIFEHCDNWKYIIRTNEVDAFEGLPSKTTQVSDPATLPINDRLYLLQRYGAPARPPQRGGVTVWLSPCDEGPGAESKTAANMRLVGELCMKHGYRAQVQVHKLLELR